MQVRILGSGSKGNALVVGGAQGALLIDCGFPKKHLQARLQHAGLELDSLCAILLTHEHGDHAAGVGPVARALGLPVYTTHGTARQAKLGKLPSLQRICPGQGFEVGDLQVLPFAVPHDAAEPVQFVISDGQRRLGVLSDAGHVTPHMLAVLQGCDTLLLEANHCPQLLAAGPYPPALQARVGGPWGHLANAQAAELLGGLDLGSLGRIVLTHLSEQNNTPQRALDVVRRTLGSWGGILDVARQDQPIPAFGV